MAGRHSYAAAWCNANMWLYDVLNNQFFNPASQCAINVEDMPWELIP